MLCASMALVVAVLGSETSPNAAELVAQLGSPVYSKREAAEASLASLGRVALPLLRSARKSRDPEIQTRAIGLVEKIEGSLLIEPSSVRLDFDDARLDQTIHSINEQSGTSLALNPEEVEVLRGRRLTVKSPESLPFWKAIDEICQAGKLHFIPGSQVPTGQREGTLLLHGGVGPQNDAVSDFGPFRIQMTGVQTQSEIQFSERRRQPFGDRDRLRFPPGELRPVSIEASRQFFLNLLVMSEPRLSVSQNGLPKLTVAVDDKGQSLLTPSSSGTFQHMAGYNGVSPSPTVRVRLDLIRPDQPGQRIRLVRGMVPIIVATRKPEPLEISIADSIGKVVQNEDVALTIHQIQTAKSNVTSMVELSIRQIGQLPRPIQLGEGEPLGYRPDSPQQQIEILDAQGNTLNWFPSGTFYNGDETRLALTVVNRSGPPIPAKVRYHSLIRASVDVPFEYRNLPMP